MHFRRDDQRQTTGDTSSVSEPRWIVELDDGREVRWQGLQTGPLCFTSEQVDELTHELLGLDAEAFEAEVEAVLRPAVGESANRPAVILHSTTPELRTFDGDLDARLKGERGGDFTTYKEARSVYLAGPGDLAVGRTHAWQGAVSALGRDAICLEDRDHYYLSHSLLHLARNRAPGSAVDRLVEHLRQEPRLVRLYAFEREMQLFLLWAARQAGLDELAVEANRPALSVAWNRKSTLHPTVTRALELESQWSRTADPMAGLQLESRHCLLAERICPDAPTFPGYSIERRDRPVEDFVPQLLRAAELLRRRYGLDKGCLKASESGDGARITPNIDLRDTETLESLGREARVHGDDYVLEAHVFYGRAEIGGQTLPTSLSAHIRAGQVAPGATIQFMEGTSWKGNILLDEAAASLFGVSDEQYARVRRFMADFQDGFERREPGLVLTGVDFGIGAVGGRFEDRPLVGVQDLNVSFTGAECLRAFLDQAQRIKGEQAQPYGVTRIFRPRPHADHKAFLEVARQFDRGPVFADAVAAIPGRWGMVGITGRDPRQAVDHLNELQAALSAAGLIEASTD